MKKLIAGLMCIFMVSQMAFAEVDSIPQESDEPINNAVNKDTEFKVSRTRFWVTSIFIGVLESGLNSAVNGILDDKRDSTEAQLFKAGINFLSSWSRAVLMYGRQNDAGVSGLDRFNPFTNIKIMFCKTA